MTENDIKHMVGCFLAWRLPENFHPDGGISFEPLGNKGTKYEYRREPTGTNLFDYTQAEAMVRHMAAELDDMPLTAEEEAMIEDAWQKHKAAAPEMTENSDKPVALKPCALNECPPGLFMFNGHMGFKSEYTTTFEKPRRYQVDAYVVKSGEYFHGGAKTSEERGQLIVQPIAVQAPVENDVLRPTSAGQSEEVVERVARAICTAEGFEPDRRNARGVINWVSYKPAARAALSALDLPTIQRDARREVELLSIISVLEVALKKIAGGHWERFGTEADVDEVPDLSADEAMRLARDALVQEFALKEGTGE